MVRVVQFPAAMETLWTRIRESLPSAYAGPSIPTPARESEVRLLRIPCHRSGRPLGPIKAARDAIVQMTRGTGGFGYGEAVSGLRRRLFGELWAQDGRQALVDDLNLLGEVPDSTWALAFEGVETADATTLTFLEEVIRRPGWLKVPIILGFRTEPKGNARRLWDLLVEEHGAPAIVEETAVAAPPAPAPGEAQGLVESTPASFELEALHRDTLRVLRASALSGTQADALLIAPLLGLSATEVLEAYQDALDQGLPLVDLGDGLFAINEVLVGALVEGITPSLKAAWNRGLATLLEPTAPSFDAIEEAPLPADSELPASSEGEPATVSDPVRAAQHHQQAGDLEAAALNLLRTAREAADASAFDVAGEYLGQARELLAELKTPSSMPLRCALHLELGRLQWLASGVEEVYTLSGAMASLEDAIDLSLDAPPALQADLHATLASVLYDIGDGPSLDRALDELSAAVRTLEGMGRPREAARYLSDMAAVWVRIGDPVRAARLMEQARQAFEEASRTDAGALLEIAEVDHLSARLPLHVKARPGLEREALKRGLEHAADAERAYARLQDERHLARVWETAGRLHAGLGDHTLALSRLEHAAATQQRLGDVLGLARTTDALASTLAAMDDPAEAVRLLSASVELNRAKGTPLGLVYNGRTLANLVGSLSPEARRQLAPELEALEEAVEAGP